MKYRVWDIRNKTMVNDALVLTETRQLIAVNADYFNDPFSFFDGCKWMLCSTKKDKNGTEIYDGDIIEFCLTPADKRKQGREHYFALIIFTGCKFIIKAKSPHLNIADKDLEDFMSDQYKVIGDIYSSEIQIEK